MTTFLRFSFLILLSIANHFVVLPQDKRAEEIPSYQKYVTDLPAVDKVEILAVGGLPSSESKDVDCSRTDIICDRWPLKIIASKTFFDEGANRVSRLWRNLRQGNGAGCFAPAYVLRFYQKDRILLTSRVCFHCCNITLPGAGGDGIVSMCGSDDSVVAFRKFVTTELPFPSFEKKK